MSTKAQQITATERIGPAKMPMDLNAGRLTFQEGAQLFGLGVGALAAGALGALLAWLVWPISLWEWSGWRFILAAFGLGTGALGLGMASITAWFAFREWSGYLRRKEDYHQLYIASHENVGGVEVERTITGWELVTDRPLHMLGLGLAVHERVLKGEETPFSERKLLGDGNVWLGGVQLGKVTPAVAQEASRFFADVGLVQGRGSRQAGRWAAQNEADVIQAVSKYWARRGGSEGVSSDD